MFKSGLTNQARQSGGREAAHTQAPGPFALLPSTYALLVMREKSGNTRTFTR